MPYIFLSIFYVQKERKYFKEAGSHAGCTAVIIVMNKHYILLLSSPFQRKGAPVPPMPPNLLHPCPQKEKKSKEKREEKTPNVMSLKRNTSDSKPTEYLCYIFFFAMFLAIFFWLLFSCNNLEKN